MVLVSGQEDSGGSGLWSSSGLYTLNYKPISQQVNVRLPLTMQTKVQLSGPERGSVFMYDLLFPT